LTSFVSVQAFRSNAIATIYLKFGNVNEIYCIRICRLYFTDDDWYKPKLEIYQVF